MKGRIVVLDTQTKWVYIGTYKKDDGTYIFLEDVDAFDASETSLSKGEYIRMVKKDGLVPNRKNVSVLRTAVAAITFLEDVLDR
jgi:hypothetical protein